MPGTFHRVAAAVPESLPAVLRFTTQNPDFDRLQKCVNPRKSNDSG